MKNTQLIILEREYFRIKIYSFIVIEDTDMVMVALDENKDITQIDTRQAESTFGTASLMINTNKSVHITLAGGLH